MHYVGTATGCSPFNKSVCRTRKSHNGLWHSDFPGNYRQSFLPRYRQSRHPPFPQCLHGPQLRPGLRPHHPNRKRSGRRGAAHSCGPATVLSPGTTGGRWSSLRTWDDAGVQIAALVGAPGNKAGAPIHPALEAIPGPIGPTAYIAELGESHRYDLPITCANAV